MRYAVLLLSVATAACTAAPGAPLTDITAASTAETGPFAVVRRTVAGPRYELQVEALRPERAQLIVDHLVEQLLVYSPREIVVEVRPDESVSGETTRVRWVRPADVPASAVPQPDTGTAAGDRIGNRPTGQSGTPH